MYPNYAHVTNLTMLVECTTIDLVEVASGAISIPVEYTMSHHSSFTETMAALRACLRQVKTAALDHVQVVLDEMHHSLDRQLPYFLTKRRGTPRVAWQENRTEDQLYDRLLQLKSHGRRGLEFLRDFVDQMSAWAAGIVRYLNTGEIFWHKAA